MGKGLYHKMLNNVRIVLSKTEGYGSDSYSNLILASIERGLATLIFCNNKAEESLTNIFLRGFSIDKGNQVQIINLSGLSRKDYKEIERIESLIDGLARDYKEVNIFMDFKKDGSFDFDEILDCYLQLENNKNLFVHLKYNLQTNNKCNELFSLFKYGAFIFNEGELDLASSCMELRESVEDYQHNVKKKVDESLHDLKNILSIINGCTRLALSEMRMDKINGYLNTILKSTLELKKPLDMISEISFSNENKKDVYDFDELVMEVVDRMKYVLKNNNMKNCSIKTRLNSYGLISCDSYSLQQAIYNILDNAVDSVSVNGNIIVSTYYKDGMIYLKIEDNGIGMDEDTLTNIFNPYYTLKGTNGTGLGMAIVKKTIERHFGSIDVRSKERAGTLVTISLPIYLEKPVIEEYANSFFTDRL